MLFNKTSICSKAWFVASGFILFNTEVNCNNIQQKLVAKDLVIFGFRKFSHKGLFLEDGELMIPNQWMTFLRGCLEPFCLL